MAEESPSNWNEAGAAPHPTCPFCTNDRDLERRGAEWFCPVCARQWLAFSRSDLQLLKRRGIAPT